MFLFFEILILKQEDMEYFDGFWKGFIEDEVTSVASGCVGVFLVFLVGYLCVLYRYWVRK